MTTQQNTEAQEVEMTMLHCGIAIPTETFFQIRGSGEAHALDRKRTMMVGNVEMEFTYREFGRIKKIIKMLTSENIDLRAQLETVTKELNAIKDKIKLAKERRAAAVATQRQEKPRIRLIAGLSLRASLIISECEVRDFDGVRYVRVTDVLNAVRNHARLRFKRTESLFRFITEQIRQNYEIELLRWTPGVGRGSRSIPINRVDAFLDFVDEKLVTTKEAA